MGLSLETRPFFNWSFDLLELRERSLLRSVWDV